MVGRNMEEMKRVVECRMGWHIVFAVVDYKMDRGLRDSLRKTVCSRGHCCSLGKTSWSWLGKRM